MDIDKGDLGLIYQGKKFAVRIGEFQTDKGTVKKELIDHPGAVVILPILEDGKVVLIQNRRFAVGEVLWELPAGTLEKGEQPLETAKREIIEETGYKANYWEPLCEFYASPGFCNEKLYAFKATGLTFQAQELQDDEDITTALFSWDQILEMIQDGRIHDGKTLTTLLYYKTFLFGK